MSTKKLPGHIVGPPSHQNNFLEAHPLGLVPAQGRLANRIEVEPKLLAALDGHWANNRQITFLDDGYYLPTVDEVRQILAASRVGRMDYVEQRFDCDDFAFGVRGEFSLYAYEHMDLRLGFSFGVLLGGFTWPKAGSNHVACVFVDNEFTVYLVEPRRLEEKVGADQPLNPDKIKLATPAESYNCYQLLL